MSWVRCGGPCLTVFCGSPSSPDVSLLTASKGVGKEWPLPHSASHYVSSYSICRVYTVWVTCMAVQACADDFVHSELRYIPAGI